LIPVACKTCHNRNQGRPGHGCSTSRPQTHPNASLTHVSQPNINTKQASRHQSPFKTPAQAFLAHTYQIFSPKSQNTVWEDFFISQLTIVLTIFGLSDFVASYGDTMRCRAGELKRIIKKVLYLLIFVDLIGLFSSSLYKCEKFFHRRA